MDITGLIIIALGYFILFALHVLFIRWVFRVNEIVQLLIEIRDSRQPHTSSQDEPIPDWLKRPIS
jgi:hypothetical protein